MAGKASVVVILVILLASVGFLLCFSVVLSGQITVTGEDKAELERRLCVSGKERLALVEKTLRMENEILRRDLEIKKLERKCGEMSEKNMHLANLAEVLEETNRSMKEDLLELDLQVRSMVMLIMEYLYPEGFLDRIPRKGGWI